MYIYIYIYYINKVYVVKSLMQSAQCLFDEFSYSFNT